MIIRARNTKSSRRKRHLWRIAAAGNGAALVLLTLVLANGSLLFEHSLPVTSVPSDIRELFPAVTFGDAVAGRVLLVVVDGLRAEYVTEPQHMPQVGRLAHEGGVSIAQVEAFIPSTVAAIQTLVTGSVAPPAAFLEDFGARPSQEGGLFAAVAGHDKQTFVAGPRLWIDLYGPWVTQAATVAGWGDTDDQHSLEATLAALTQESYKLIVVHFSQTDAAAHRHGAHSPEYRRAVAWCDTAIGQLVEHAGTHTAVVVTSDHGVTAYGGHAGPEPDVLATPLVTWGPGTPRGIIGTVRQRDIFRLILHALGLTPAARQPHTAATTSAPFPSGQSKGLTSAGRAFLDSAAVPFVVVALISVAGGLRLWAALATGATGRVEATVLNAILWVGLLLSLLGRRTAALVLITSALSMISINVRPGIRIVVPGALTIGLLFGATRVGDGALTSQSLTVNVLDWSVSPTGSAATLSFIAMLTVLGTWRLTQRTGPGHRNSIRVGGWVTPAWILAFTACAVAAYALGGITLLGLYMLTVSLGASFGRALRGPRAAALLAGMACAFVSVALARLLGETVSLSTLDVRVAFTLMEEAGGLPAAVGVVVVRHAMLTWGVLLGLALAFPQAKPIFTGCFVAGLATVSAAQALVATTMLALPETGIVFASLALGTLVRLFLELTAGFLGCALICWLVTTK